MPVGAHLFPSLPRQPLRRASFSPSSFPSPPQPQVHQSSVAIRIGCQALVLEFKETMLEFLIPSLPQRNETSHKHSWLLWVLNASTQEARCIRRGQDLLCSSACGSLALVQVSRVQVPNQWAEFPKGGWGWHCYLGTPARLFLPGISSVSTRPEGCCDNLRITQL